MKSTLAQTLHAHTFSREPKTSAVLSVALVGLLAAAAAGGCEGPSLDQRIKSALSPEPMPSVIERIASASPDERREALQTAAADRDTRTIPKVVDVFCIKAKSDTDPLVRSAAVRGLGQMDGADVVPSLAFVLAGDGSPYVRSDAAVALGRQAKPECVAPLAKALRTDPSSDVRVVVAGALRNFRDPAAAKALVAALGDRSLAVEQQAWESLRYMTGQDLVRQPAPWDEFLASSADPFAAYGHPPRILEEPSQRPQLIRGPMDLFRDLFTKDPNEAELE